MEPSFGAGVRVRRGTLADASAILDVLERSLSGDPFVRWLTRGEPRAMRSYLRLMLRRIALPKGIAHVTVEPDALQRDSVERESIASVALWAPPHTFALSAGESLRLLPTMLRVIGPLRFSRVALVLDEIERARPPEPRWLLTLLGTLPELRGRGHASAALGPALARCDLDGHVAVCETSEPANLAFYARHGFVVTAERRLEAQGPTTYTLQREPRSPGGGRRCYPREP